MVIFDFNLFKYKFIILKYLDFLSQKSIRSQPKIMNCPRDYAIAIDPQNQLFRHHTDLYLLHTVVSAPHRPLFITYSCFGTIHFIYRNPSNYYHMVTKIQIQIQVQIQFSKSTKHSNYQRNRKNFMQKWQFMQIKLVTISFLAQKLDSNRFHGHSECGDSRGLCGTGLDCSTGT